MPVPLRIVIALLVLDLGLAAQSSPERSRAMPFYREGFAQMRAEAWARASDAFTEATRIDPTFEMAYYGLGRALLPQRRYVEAIAALTSSRNLFRGHAGAHFTNQQDAQRYRHDRITEIDEVLRQYQTGPQTLRTQDVVRQLQERKRQLQQDLQRGNNLTIEDTVPAFVSLSLGSAYFRAGKLADAEREFKAAVLQDPKIGEAHNNLAVVYLETGRVADAERSVAAAQRAGFKVHPQLIEDIKARKNRS